MAEFASMTMKDLKGYLSREQVEAIINSTSNLRDRLILQVMYRCGRRVSEVLMITKDDILWNEDKIIFNILKRKKAVKEMKPVDTTNFNIAVIHASVEIEGKSNPEDYLVNTKEIAA